MATLDDILLRMGSTIVSLRGRVARLEGQPTAKKNNAAATTPSGSDDQTAGYSVGSLWVDTAAEEAYICVDNSAGSAQWKIIT